MCTFTSLMKLRWRLRESRGFCFQKVYLTLCLMLSTTFKCGDSLFKINGLRRPSHLLDPAPTMASRVSWLPKRQRLPRQSWPSRTNYLVSVALVSIAHKNTRKGARRGCRRRTVGSFVAPQSVGSWRDSGSRGTSVRSLKVGPSISSRLVARAEQVFEHKTPRLSQARPLCRCSCALCFVSSLSA